VALATQCHAVTGFVVELLLELIVLDASVLVARLVCYMEVLPFSIISFSTTFRASVPVTFQDSLPPFDIGSTVVVPPPSFHSARSCLI